MQGDFGKPRPALVIQSDIFSETHLSLIFLPITNDLIAAPLFRTNLSPNERNGLPKPCQVMVGKVMTVRKEKIDFVFGRIDEKAITN